MGGHFITQCEEGSLLVGILVKNSFLPFSPPPWLTHQCFCLPEEGLDSKTRLVCSVHALSYFLKTSAVVDKSVQDFAHTADGEEEGEGVGVR